MNLAALAIVFGSCCALATAQIRPATYKLALPSHKGQMKWSANGFSVTRSVARTAGQGIDLSGRDSAGRLTFQASFFLDPDNAPLSSAKRRDKTLDRTRSASPGVRSLG
jgi:hypothetical protein